MHRKPDGSWDKSKLPSRHVTEGPARAPHRSYYYAMGLGTREINQPFVGRRLLLERGRALQHRADAPGPRRQPGREGGRRDAARVLHHHRHRRHRHGPRGHALVAGQPRCDRRLGRADHARPAYDALVGVAGCDKSLPGMMMAMLRLNVPSVFLYGGSILPGRWQGRDVTVVDVFEARRPALGRQAAAGRPLRAGAVRLPRRRRLRRPVHRQHHGLRLRGDRPGPAALGGAAGALREPRPVCASPPARRWCG